LERILSLLRRRGLVILLVAIAFGAIALGLSLLQSKQYSSTAELLFRNPNYAQSIFGSGAAIEATDPSREAATNAKLVGLNVVARRTAKKLGDITSEEVANSVEASAVGEAELVAVTAKASSPLRAAVIANTFARQFIAFRAEADKSKLLEAQQLAETELARLTVAEQEGARGQSLSRGAARLGILASLQTGNAELVQPANIPKSPSSPRPARNALIAAVLGLLVGIGLLVFLERLNPRLRDAEDVAEATGLSILGTIPDSKSLKAADPSGVASELPSAGAEAFRTLRASLRYFNVDREIKTVLVTSFEAGAGKSTVAWNLARAASSSTRAIVIEGDLRNPSLGRQHNLRMGPGLAELLTHQVGLDEAIQSKALPESPSANGGSNTSLDVIVAGSIPPNPAELLESQALFDVLHALRQDYDFIVIDTAPIGVVADSFPVLTKVDGVLAVVRMGRSKRDSAKRLCARLLQLESPLLGVVANGIKRSRGDRYGYGYYAGGPTSGADAVDSDPDRAKV
jgi:receptor protein-tyrosine kinase